MSYTGYDCYNVECVGLYCIDMVVGDPFDMLQFLSRPLYFIVVCWCYFAALHMLDDWSAAKATQTNIISRYFFLSEFVHFVDTIDFVSSFI